jgi:hypothetical protein
LYPEKSRAALTAIIEGVQLNALLKFFNYQGAKGQGALFGKVPLKIRWGEQKSLSLGKGYIEARPSKGVIGLSRENAKAVLGVKKDINPQAADLKEEVTLMMIRALQDMEYTLLRASFSEERGGGTLTKIEIKGQGPRGRPDEQIPIGGLTVNIHNTEDLLSAVLFRPKGAQRIEFR